MKRPKHPWLLALAAVLVLGLGIFGFTRGGGEEIDTVPLSSALAQIDSGDVKSITLDDSTRTAEITTKDGEHLRTGYTSLYGSELVEKAEAKDVEVKAEPLESSATSDFLLYLVPMILILGVLVWVSTRGSAATRFSRGREAQVDIPVTRFKDVAGADEAVEELKEVVEYLHDPKRFEDAGAKVPHGFLLEGPPGTGKTLLARAVAGEAGVPFFALSGSDFVEMFVGVGPRRVRDLFKRAREMERAIIFIDEIDAVGKQRSSGQNMGATEERESTLNALLVEMDGFTSTGIIVLAATNRSDVLDSALLRPGRFDRKINVPAPDVAGRRRLFELYAKERSFEGEVDFASYARRTPGLTGADISFLLNEAVLEAARKGRKSVTAADIDSALATAVLGRERRSAVISERDRRITAWHEAGHALAALLQKDADDPVSVTIIPRGPAGGVTWMGGNDDTFVAKTKAWADLVVSLAGRAAEERLLGGDYTSGASSDLKAATDLATRMVLLYGMSDTGRLFSYASENAGGGGLPDEIRSEVDRMLQQSLARARKLIAEHAELFERVVEELLEKETVTLEDMVRLQIDVEGHVDSEALADPDDAVLGH